MKCYSSCIADPGKDVLAKSQIACDICDKWFHKSCAGLNDPYLKNIFAKESESGKKTPLHYWKCWLCAEKFLGWGDQLKRLQKLEELVVNKETKCDCSHEVIKLTRKLEELEVKFASFQLANQGAINIHRESEGVEAHPVKNAKKHRRSKGGAVVPGFQNKSQQSEDRQFQVSPASTSADEDHVSDVSDVNDEDGEFKRVNRRRRNKHVIIGNSLVRDARQHIHFQEARVIAMPGATVRAAIEQVQKMSPDSEVETVVFHVGGNDLMNAPSPDYVIGDLYNLVKLTKDRFVNANIIVNGILWRKGISMKLLRTINDDIKWVTKCLNVSYADPNEKIKRSHFTKDEVHLNAQGNRTFANFLKNSLKMLARVTRA